MARSSVRRRWVDPSQLCGCHGVVRGAWMERGRVRERRGRARERERARTSHIAHFSIVDIPGVQVMPRNHRRGCHLLRRTEEGGRWNPQKNRKEAGEEKDVTNIGSRLLTSTAPTHSGHLALVRIALSRQSRWKTCPHEMIASSFSSGPRLCAKEDRHQNIYKREVELFPDGQVVEKTVVAVHTVLIVPHRLIYEAEGWSRMDWKARRTKSKS